METEAKTKVVASELIKFLAVLAVLHRSIWKKRMNSNFSSKSAEAKQLARQGIESTLPANRRNDLSLCLLLFEGTEQCFRLSSQRVLSTFSR